MTEWSVVGVIIALAGLMATIVKPLTNLTRSITKLTVVVDRLESDMNSHKNADHESHRRLWEHSENQDRKIANHEYRLTALEEYRE